VLEDELVLGLHCIHDLLELDLVLLVMSEELLVLLLDFITARDVRFQISNDIFDFRYFLKKSLVLNALWLRLQGFQ
jgi:hypothetical protein